MTIIRQVKQKQAHWASEIGGLIKQCFHGKNDVDTVIEDGIWKGGVW
jgi:hypothetical protein